MEYQQYLKFLSQLSSSLAGVIHLEEVKIFFSWDRNKAKMTFSSLIDGNDQFSCERPLSNRRLKWSDAEPFFQQTNKNLFLTYEIKGIPSYKELKIVVNKFISLLQEFNDQSMGSLSQLLR